MKICRDEQSTTHMQLKLSERRVTFGIPTLSCQMSNVQVPNVTPKRAESDLFAFFQFSPRLLFGGLSMRVSVAQKFQDRGSGSIGVWDKALYNSGLGGKDG